MLSESLLSDLHCNLCKCHTWDTYEIQWEQKALQQGQQYSTIVDEKSELKKIESLMKN